jgi:hypothetical protein
MNARHALQPQIFLETFSFNRNYKMAAKPDLNCYTMNTYQAYFNKVPMCGVTAFSATSAMS